MSVEVLISNPDKQRILDDVSCLNYQNQVCEIFLSLAFSTSVSEEKQKSDAEEDGGTISQEEEDRKPKAEVK